MAAKTPPRSPTSILQPHISGPGCLCAMCVGPTGAKAAPSPQSIMNDLARRVDWIVHRVPTKALGKGMVNAQLDSALQHLMPLANEELGSPLYASTPIMAVNEKARQVVAAGLYSPDPRSQAAACMAIPCMIRDGDVIRGKPMYCDDLDRRFVQLLSTETPQVHDAICRALSVLARGDCFLALPKSAPPGDPRRSLAKSFRQKLIALGVVSRLLGILSRPEQSAQQKRAFDLDKLQAHAAEALAALCWRWRELEGPAGAALCRQVTSAPAALRRLAKLAERVSEYTTASRSGELLSTLRSHPSNGLDREIDEVPRRALECLAAVAAMGSEGRFAVKNAGAEEAARVAAAGLVGRPHSSDANQECLKHAVSLLAILQGLAPEGLGPRLQSNQRSSSWSGDLPTSKNSPTTPPSTPSPGSSAPSGGIFRPPRKSDPGPGWGPTSPGARSPGTPSPPPLPKQMSRRWSAPPTTFQERAGDSDEDENSDDEARRETEAVETATARTLQSMTIRELKAALREAGVRSDDAVEKEELVARARKHIARLKIKVTDGSADVSNGWHADADIRIRRGGIGNLFGGR